MKLCYFAVLALSLLAYPTTGYAMPVDTFMQKANDQHNGKIPLHDFLAICDAELAGDAKDDTNYQSQIYGDRAYARLLAGDLATAKTDNAKALELRPKSARALFNQGAILAQEGKYTEAYIHTRDCAQRASNPKMQAAFQHTADKYRESAAVTAVALWAAFDENEVSAEDMYKGKPVFVKGTISAITTDPAGYPVVSLNAGKNGFAKVNCVFPKDVRPVIGKLKKGSQVLISGMCAGMTMGHVFIKNCTVD